MESTEELVHQNKPSPQISPLDIYASLSSRERIFVSLALVAAIITITLFAIIQSPYISEIVSGYVTVIFLLWLAVIDYKSFTLPNIILLAWLGCRIVLIFAGIAVTASFDILISSISGAVAMGILFLIVYYASKRSLGGGDVKLSFVLGLAITIYMAFTAVFLSLILCAIFSSVAVALKKLTRKDPVPLGPFLFIGTVVTYLFLIGG